MKRSFHLLVLLCVFSKFYSQEFFPEITNYSMDQYAFDKQNWDIDINDDGVVFVANNAGLLIYNGQNWQKYFLPNKTVVRSVLCVNNRIYTGSYQEFGYWTKDYFGIYQYTSLVPKLEKVNQISDQEFWQIFNHKGNIFFKSFSGGVYVYDGTKVSHIEGSFGTHDMCVYDDKTLFANREKGLIEYKNGGVIPFATFENANKYESVNNVATNSEKLFFYDLLKGGFLFDRELNKIDPLPKKLNIFLHDNILNKATFVSESKLVLGTIKKGIVIYDLTLNSTQFIHGETGIQNNTVLGLKSHSQNLWVALDSGVSKININSPISFYTENSGSLGTVYDVAFFDDNYYLGSNTGVYTFTEDNQLRLIEGLEDHVWDIYTTEEDLLIGHNYGCFLVQKGRLVERISETGVFSTVKIPERENEYLQGTYYGINFLRKENGIWKSEKVEDVPFLVDKIIFESQYVIWVSHPYEGVHRMELSEDYFKVVKSVYYGDYEHFYQHKTNIYVVNDTILFYNSDNWYQYFKSNDSIGQIPQFKKLENRDLITVENNGKWFVNRAMGQTISLLDDSNKEKLKMDANELRNRMVSKYEKIRVKDDSLHMLNLNDGFAVFNINELKKQKPIIKKPPVIDKIYSDRKQFISNGAELKIPYSDAQYLSFEIHSPEQYGNSHVYTLNGEIEQTAMVEGGQFTLQNLDYGDYVLSLTNGLQNSSNEKKLAFTVLPPWYLSTGFKILYVVLFVLSIVSIHIINQKSIRKQNRKTQKKYVRKMQNAIYKMERQNLEKALKSKTTELVGFAEASVEKNEIIMVLSNELGRTQKGDVNKARIKSALQLTNDHLKVNREWNVFKRNFDELNSQFLKKLTQEFPSITSRDLRLCAYIKTGLKSKEIAPLLGISVRGVEHHRNRLRKKLKLASDKKLSTFLEHFV